MLLSRFDPPGNMTDFDSIPGQLEQWSKAVSGWIDESIQSELQLFQQQTDPKARENICQFFNPSETDPGGTPIDQQIVWNAFPRTLQLAFNFPTAYQAAETL